MRHLVVQRGRVVQIGRRSVPAFAMPWNLDRQTISEYKEYGLDVISGLLIAERRTEFQDSLLDSVMIYSKSPLARAAEEKLIYILVALESLLLRDQNEPVQDNVAARMAYLIKDTADERRRVIGNVKATYAIRSAFIHHGHGIREGEVLGEFMMSVWELFLRLIENVDRFATRQELIETVEKGRLSGMIA